MYKRQAVNNTVKELSFTGGTGNFTALLGYADAINVYLYGAEKGFSTIYTADSTAKEWENAMWTGLFGALEKLITLAEDEENNQITDAYVENIIANITYDAKAKEDGFYLSHRVSAGDSVVDSDKTCLLYTSNRNAHFPKLLVREQTLRSVNTVRTCLLYTSRCV